MKFVCLLLAVGAMAQNPKANGCPGQKIVLLGDCVKECPDGYVTTQANGYAECLKCPIESFRVPDSSGTKCVCASNFYESSSVCLPCDPTCGTCSGSLCLTCDPRTSRVLQGSQCVCPAGFWDDRASGAFNCQSCHSSCGTCSGPDDSQCITCGPGRIKDALGNCVCLNNLVPDNFGKCICPAPYSISAQGNCIESPNNRCGPNEVEQPGSGGAIIINGNGKANGNAKKTTTVSTSQPICDCRTGLVRIKGVCGTCGQNQVYNSVKQSCDCAKGAIAYNGQCIVCPADQKFSRRDGECQCPKNQQQDELGNCIKCAAKERYQIGAGCTCLPNFYRAKNNKCQKCHTPDDDPLCVFLGNLSDKKDLKAIDA